MPSALVELLMMVVMTGVMLTPTVYLFNRSRYPLAEAAQLSGCPEQELQALIKEGLLTYRRKYLLFGPHSVDIHDIAKARADARTLQEVRAETEAMLRRSAEEIAAQMQESNRRLQEQQRQHEEELERMRRIHAEILRQMRASLGVSLMPQEVVASLVVLGLPQDASFETIRQRYRILAKQYHPDASGDPEQFKRIDLAYKRVLAWIKSQEKGDY